MSETKCEYCGKILKNKYNLKNHQRRVKSCIEIQKKNNINIDYDIVNCEYCFGSFNQTTIGRHRESCKVKKEKLIQEDKDTIKELENKIKELELIIAELNGRLSNSEKDHDCVIEIAKQPKITKTTNNKILNMSPVNLSTERIKDIIDTEFNHNYISGGQKGVAEFAKEKLLLDDEGNPTYICTDSERKVFKYKDELGAIQKDDKAKKLTNKLVKAGLIQKNKKEAEKWWLDENGNVIKDRHNFITVRMAEINNIENNNSIFTKELASIIVP